MNMLKLIQPVETRIIDKLKIHVYESRKLLGTSAGFAVAEKMRELLAQKPFIRMIFAAAPSQNEFLETLVKAEGIDWSRVTVFHMDEYIGLPERAPQRFSRFLCERLFNIVQPGKVHLLNCVNTIEEECSRYTALLEESPIDIVCLGIGENGHIAFNDPPVADFNDPYIIKPVELDESCRKQQVNDGCFASIDLVPTHALTLTIPAITSATYLFGMVPGTAKKDAVYHTLNGPISTKRPASILRQHEHCTLYLDTDSYGVGEKK